MLASQNRPLENIGSKDMQYIPSAVIVVVLSWILFYMWKSVKAENLCKRAHTGTLCSQDEKWLFEKGLRYIDNYFIIDLLEVYAKQGGIKKLNWLLGMAYPYIRDKCTRQLKDKLYDICSMHCETANGSLLILCEQYGNQCSTAQLHTAFSKDRDREMQHLSEEVIAFLRAHPKRDWIVESMITRRWYRRFVQLLAPIIPQEAAQKCLEMLDETNVYRAYFPEMAQIIISARDTTRAEELQKYVVHMQLERQWSTETMIEMEDTIKKLGAMLQEAPTPV